MASVPGGRSRTLETRSGGKMVRARRAAGSATPYERPRLADSDDSPNPNWISKLILSPTRAIATGAGKLISVVFSQEDSDSDSDSSNDSSSEGNLENDLDEDDFSSQRAVFSKERNKESDTTKYFMKDLEPETRKRDRICAIEELILKETFTREECSKLIYVIQSRVVDGLTTTDVETGRHTRTPKEASPAEAEEQNLRNTAVMEARKWLSERKLKASSSSDLDMAVENEVGSPVDMAKTYMRTRPLWASPTFKHGEFTSPSPMVTHLFQEETPYSLGGNSMSSSKLKRKTDTPTTGGSWNIQEEIQRVRAKATEEMLSTLPSKKIDWPSFGFEKRPYLHTGGLTETIYNNASEKVDKSAKPRDASLQAMTGIFSTHGLETTPADLQKEASLPNEANIITGKIQGSQVIHLDDGAGPKNGSEPGVSGDPRPKNASLSEAGVNTAHDHEDSIATDKQLRNSEGGSLQDLRSHESGYSKLKEVAITESTPTDNGLPLLGNSFSAEPAAPGQDAELDGEDRYSVSSTSNDISTGVIEDKTCELLTETDVDVPNMSDDGTTNEGDHMGNGASKDSGTNQQSRQRYTRKGTKRGLVGDPVKKQGNRPSRYRKTRRDISTQ